MTIPYKTGTVSVTAGNAVVTGSGTAWQTALIVGGTFGLASGISLPIQSVDSDTQITLAYPWPGATASGQTYWIVRDTAYGQQTVANANALAQIIADLRSAVLSAFAGLMPSANTFAYFTGATTAAVSTVTSFARTLLGSADAGAARTTLGAVAKSGDSMTGPLLAVGGFEAKGASASGVVNYESLQRFSGPSGLAGEVYRNYNVTTGDYLGWQATVQGQSSIKTAIVLQEFGGRVGIGTAVPLAVVHAKAVSGAAAVRGQTPDASIAFEFVRDSGNPGWFGGFRINGGADTVGSIQYSGGGTVYVTSSDYRLKTNVTPLVEFALSSDQFDLLDNSLLRIMAMRPVSYLWSDHQEFGLQTGFIAHELQIAAPHAVAGDKDGVEDIGTATIPAQIIPAHTIPGQTVQVLDPESGDLLERRTPDSDVPEVRIPAQIFENVREGEIDGAMWIKTGTRPVFQGVDHGRLTPDIIAAQQSLTLLCLSLEARITALEAQIESLTSVH